MHYNLMAKPYGPHCNNACSYCFYLDKKYLFEHKTHTDYKMSPEILETFIKEYIHSHPDDAIEVVFSWQGGEPTLLGTGFFEQVLKLQQKHNINNIKIRNSLQTNGTLISKAMAQFFNMNDFLIGISIDGPEHLHNRYRLGTDGKGTFAQVMRGLEKLQDHDVAFNTLTVVNNINSEQPLEVYDFLKKIGSTYLQFIPLVEPLGTSSVSSRTVHSEKWGDFLLSVFKEWLKIDIGKIFVQHFDLVLGLYMGQPASLCVHGKYCGQAPVIEHNGNLYSCDHFVTQQNYIGHIDDGLSNIVQSEKQVRFGMDKYDTLPQECLTCQYLPLCYGGCPKNRLIRKKTGQLNWLCTGYQHFYKETQAVFTAMARALQDRISPALYRKYLHITAEMAKNLGRNDFCPCLSGKKFKNCHGA